MANRGQQWAMIAGVAVVVVGVVGWRSRRASPARPATAATTPSLPSPDLAPLAAYAAPLSDSALAVVSTADSVVVRRDPFYDDDSKPLAAKPRASGHRVAHVDAGEWHVSATLIAGTRRAAVINDALVYEGDAIPGGGKLTSVERDRVVVTDPHGATHTVTVKEGDG